MAFAEVVEIVGMAIDATSVAAIVLGVLTASVSALDRVSQHQPDAYPRYRRQLGRSIILGLELLVTADIIRTVAVTRCWAARPCSPASCSSERS